MDAANPLGRCLLFAVGLAALLGCQTDRAAQIAPLAATTRAQQPTDPLAPLAPPAPPGVVTGPPVVGGPVIGSPVGLPAPDAKGPVVPAALTGPTKADAAASAATAADLLRTSQQRVRIVARVGKTNLVTDQEVVEGVYMQFRELFTLDGRERAAKQKEMYRLVLRRTIERELILDEMYTRLEKANKGAVIQELKEYATDSANRQIRLLRTNAGAKSDDEFAAFLRVQGLTVEVVRRQMERQLMADEYVRSTLKEKTRRVGLSDVRDYYDKHPELFRTPDRVTWQHLYVAAKNYPNPQAAYNRLVALGQQAAGGADFGALSAQFDEGFAKQQKGFGTGEARGEIQPADLEATVWGLKPGETSGILQTPTGYHLVKVVTREYAGVKPFDTAVQNKIRERVTRAQMDAERQKLVEELWRKTVVQVFEE